MGKNEIKLIGDGENEIEVRSKGKEKTLVTTETLSILEKERTL